MDDQVKLEEENTTVEEPEGGQSTISINGKEYTVEELQKFEEKAKGYDALLPDYTKKAQRLSELETDKKAEEKADKAPYELEDWQPKDYKELAQAIKLAEERGMKKAVEYLENQKNSELELRKQVDGWVGGVQKSDKEFDQQDFFDFALRHKFVVDSVAHLDAVYSSYKEMRDAGVKKSDDKPDRVNKGSSEGKPDFSNLKSKGILERALEAYDKIKN